MIRLCFYATSEQSTSNINANLGETQLDPALGCLKAVSFNLRTYFVRTSINILVRLPLNSFLQFLSVLIERMHQSSFL